MNTPAEIAAMCDEGIALFTRLKTLAGSADAFVRSLQDVLQGRQPTIATLVAPNPPPNKRGRRMRIVPAAEPEPTPTPAAKPTKRVVSEQTRQRMREAHAKRKAERLGSAANIDHPPRDLGEARPRQRRGDTMPINPMRLPARDDTPTLVDPLRGVSAHD